MKKTKLSLTDFNVHKLTKKHSLTINGGLTPEGILTPEQLDEETWDPNDPGDTDWGGPGSGTISGTTAATLLNSAVINN